MHLTLGILTVNKEIRKKNIKIEIQVAAINPFWVAAHFI
jgi:hypothetical protein